jgi:chromosome segregation ATPase
MDRAEIEARLESAEQRRREAESHLAENAERLERLEEERAELLGRSQLAKQHLRDFDAQLAKLQAELAAIEVEEARAEFEAAVQERDDAFVKAAEAVDGVAAAVEELGRARAHVDEAHRLVTRLDPGEQHAVPPEPSTFEDRWHEAEPLVEAELNARHEVRLVEEAVRDSNPLVIDQLPEHLRDLARRRKRELILAAQRARGR